MLCHVEIDKDCGEYLKRRWPDVPLIKDIHDFSVDTFCQLIYDRLSTQAKEEFDMAFKGQRIKDYDPAVEMYEKGLSVGEIAEYYEITRQAMWMILKRRGVVFRNNLRFGKENHFYRGTDPGKASEKKRAGHIVEQAIKKGILHPDNCELCGSDRKVEAHHDDYNFPLRIRWLCKKHHHEWHKTNAAIARKEVLSERANAETVVDLVCGGPP